MLHLEGFNIALHEASLAVAHFQDQRAAGEVEGKNRVVMGLLRVAENPVLVDC